MNSTLFVMINVIGTIAFAISRVEVAVHKRMDLFGVNIPGLTTAVGGGAIRDILTGALAIFVSRPESSEVPERSQSDIHTVKRFVLTDISKLFTFIVSISFCI